MPLAVIPLIPSVGMSPLRPCDVVVLRWCVSPDLRNRIPTRSTHLGIWHLASGDIHAPGIHSGHLGVGILGSGHLGVGG